MEKVEPSCNTGRDIKWCSSFRKQSGSSSVTCDIAIPLLGVYPRELNTYVHTKTWTQMFTAALYIYSQKAPKCPSIDGLIKKMWYIHTMEYYSAKRRNEVIIHTATWMNHKILC